MTHPEQCVCSTCEQRRALPPGYLPDSTIVVTSDYFDELAKRAVLALCDGIDEAIDQLCMSHRDPAFGDHLLEIAADRLLELRVKQDRRQPE